MLSSNSLLSGHFTTMCVAFFKFLFYVTLDDKTVEQD